MAAASPRSLVTAGVVFTSDHRIALAAALLSAVVASFALAAPIDPFDGGISSSAATFTLHGLLPYRDYWLLYGPLGGWLLAVPLAVLGPSVELLRVAGLLLVAAHAYLGCLIALRWARPGAAILIATCAAILAPAFTGLEFGAWPLAMALALAALRLRMEGRAPTLVGVLVGLAFLTRLDLGGYALIACLVMPGRLPCLLGFGAVTLPLVMLTLLSTPAVWLFEQVVWYPTIGLRRFRVLPDLAATMTPLSATVLAVPLALVPRVAILASVLSTVRAKADRPALALTVFAALCQFQGLGRADAEHLAMAATPAILLLSRWVTPDRLGSTALLAFVSATCIGGAAAGFADQADTDRAQQTALVQAVDVVASTTTRDEPIFVGLVAHRHTFSNPLMAYYLADRSPGTTWTLFNPGLTNTELVQRQMIDELEASGTNVLVLDVTLAEYYELDNESRVAGSDVLDRYIADRFHVLCDFGAVLVSVRNEVASLDGGCPVANGSP